MADSQRVNITVPEAMYVEWKDAVDEGVASSISELVRTSVNRSLDGNLGGSQVAQEGGDGLQSDEAMGYLERMDSTLSDVHERVERIEEEERSTSQTTGVDLQEVVARILPEVALPPTASQAAIEEEAVRPDGPVTAEELAGRIDGEYAEVLDALIKAQPGYPSMASFEADDGTTYWWREG